MSNADPCRDGLGAIVAAFNRRGTVEPGLGRIGAATTFIYL